MAPFEHARAITGKTMSDTILTDRGTCCVRSRFCKRVVKTGPPYNVDPRYGGPEYETLGSFGSSCGVDDLEAICKANEICNTYAIDTISTGMTIAFAMECYENGILTRDDLDGLDLRWGNADAAIEMIHKICRRDGIGSVLAEGVKRAAEQIGRGAERYAMHVKGQELPMHEPRGKVGVGLAYAVSPTGADHMEADHDPTFESLGIAETGWEPLGLLEPVDRFDLGPDKVRAFKYAQTTFNLYNSVGMCDFVGVPINALRFEMLRDYINGATGWDMSLFEMMKVGERANTMYRLFNLREGFTAADDTLPDRLFEGLNNGHLEAGR